MTSATSQQLVRRLRKVLQKWPSDPSREGRDLGAYLNKNYEVKFKDLLRKDDQKARKKVESLERLHSNHYRRLYVREKELGFSGGVVANNPWILSNQNLDEMKQKSRTLWERITGRNK